MNGRRGFDGLDLDLAPARAAAHITNHALLRYIQRIEGRDTDLIKQVLLSDEALPQAIALGASSVYLPSIRAWVMLKKTVVTTILTPGSPERG